MRWRREEGTGRSDPGASELLSFCGSVSNCRALANDDFFTGELTEEETQGSQSQHHRNILL